MVDFPSSKIYSKVSLVASDNLVSAEKQIELLKSFVAENLAQQEQNILSELSTDSAEFSDDTGRPSRSNSEASIFQSEHFSTKKPEDTRSIGILNLSHLLTQFHFFTQNLSRVQPFYAVKCHPDPKIIQVLADLGCGFDCASKNEIMLVKDVLVNNIRQAIQKSKMQDTKITAPNQILSSEIRNRIIFANPCKPNLHLAYSFKNNVQKVTFDSEQELVKIAKFLPNASCILRIVCDDETAVCQFGMKFGAALSQVENLLKTLRQLNLHFGGVSFHVGSGCQNFETYTEAIKKVKYVFDLADEILEEDSMIAPRILDIGGGFPGGDFNSQARENFVKICQIVNKNLEEIFPAEKYHNLKIIAEPGRFFAEGTMTLATQITAINDDVDKNVRIYLNDGVYGSFNCILFDHAVLKPYLEQKSHKSKDAQSKQESETNLATIFGPTCDGLDLICEKIQLPKYKVNDWMYWNNMGAYTVAAGSTFNGFQRPKIYHLMDPESETYLMNMQENYYQTLLNYFDKVSKIM